MAELCMGAEHGADAVHGVGAVHGTGAVHGVGAERGVGDVHRVGAVHGGVLCTSWVMDSGYSPGTGCRGQPSTRTAQGT